MITKSSINSMRVMVEETLSGNEFFFGQYQRKTLKEAGILLNDDSKFLKEKKIREKLSELLARLPKGKADYMSLEMMGLRPLVDEIGMTMLSLSPDLDDGYFSMRQELLVGTRTISRNSIIYFIE